MTEIPEEDALPGVGAFKVGGSSLRALERNALGPFIREGVTLLHPACGGGLDTLSWARRGARVTGLDASGAAVSRARHLAAEGGLSHRAEFVRAELVTAEDQLGARRFDVVFAGPGTTGLLPDLQRWAAAVARRLRGGGTFFLTDLHPFAAALDEAPGERDVCVGSRLLPAAGGRGDPARVLADSAGEHGDGAELRDPTRPRWHHSLSEVVGAVVGAGLRLERLHESPASPLRLWEWMVPGEDGSWWLPDGEDGRRRDLPLAYALRARLRADGDGRPTADA